MDRSEAGSLRSSIIRAAAVAAIAVATNLASLAKAATLVVDPDGHATSTDCLSGAAVAFTSIQAAVAAAQPGDTVLVCPGTYGEQVVVSKSDLTIRGADAGTAIVRPAVLSPLTTSVATPAQQAQSPVLLVDGAAGVTLAGLVVDGALAASARVSGNPNCGFQPHMIGIEFRNASGTIDGVHVKNILSAIDCTFGVRVENGLGASGQVTVTRSRVDNYADFGISCAGFQTSCTVRGSEVRGSGPVQFNQGGVTMRFGALGLIEGNLITDHYFIGAQGLLEFSIGVFLADADPKSNPHLLRDNTFANNQLNVQRISTEAAIH